MFPDNNTALDPDTHVIYTASHEPLLPSAVGTILIQTAHPNVILRFTGAYYFPPDKLRSSLMPLGQLDRSGYKIVFTDQMCIVKQNDKQLLSATLTDNDTYLFTDLQFITPGNSHAYLTRTTHPGAMIPRTPTLQGKAHTIEYWHITLGHLSLAGLTKLIQLGYIHFSNKPTQLPACSTCSMAKATRLNTPHHTDTISRQPKAHTSTGEATPQTQHQSQTTGATISEEEKIIGVIAADLFFPGAYDIHRHRVALHIRYPFAGYSNAVMLPAKSAAGPALIKEIKLTERTFPDRLKLLYTDNGGEFISHTVRDFCDSIGLPHKRSVAHFHQSNAFIERANRHLETITRCLLLHSGVPTKFYNYALSYACTVNNCTIFVR